MPGKLLSCVSLPPATITSVPIYDYAKANEKLENEHGRLLSMLRKENVQGAYTPSGNLETLASVRFVIPTETKQMKKLLEN
jgi:hypothetical protein